MNEVMQFGFLSISWIDLVDVAIVAVAFWFVYRSLRDTLALQVLFLLSILLVLSFFTDALGLETVNWILRRLGDIGLIAFVVLFQPELRRLVLLLTRGRVFRLFLRTRSTEVIDIVVDAIEDLTSSHIGALIVFSRADHIKVTVDTGVKLNATASAELLSSIFNPRSPLHDGAVVIDGQMLVAARCVLPLSTTQRVGSRTLGTRHRAGLGLSEQADAVVVIVSEERGTVSLAYGGELEIDIPLPLLRVTLQQRISSYLSA
ncbi:MAG TPA: TIGR00159 family protein [Bacteroidetes bacterium]|nr:TIGR00159 family protein [Bacteroidota bacterium]